MNSNIVRAAQWIAVGMVCSSMLLLGGFYWISNHQQQRLLHELRGGSFGPTDSTLIVACPRARRLRARCKTAAASARDICQGKTSRSLKALQLSGSDARGIGFFG